MNSSEIPDCLKNYKCRKQVCSADFLSSGGHLNVVLWYSQGSIIQNSPKDSHKISKTGLYSQIAL